MRYERATSWSPSPAGSLRPGGFPRVEREEVVDQDDRVTFSEVCEYPDGSRIVVETTLEVRSGKIFRQTDVVAKDTWAVSEGETDPAEAKG